MDNTAIPEDVRMFIRDSTAQDIGEAARLDLPARFDEAVLAVLGATKLLRPHMVIPRIPPHKNVWRSWNPKTGHLVLNKQVSREFRDLVRSSTPFTGAHLPKPPLIIFYRYVFRDIRDVVPDDHFEPLQRSMFKNATEHVLWWRVPTGKDRRSPRTELWFIKL